MNATKTKQTDETKKAGKRTSILAILFSVFSALLLWFYVQEAEAPDYKKTFSSVSVQVQDLSSSFSALGGDEIFADVTLVGKRSDLNKIKASDLQAYVDLSGITKPGNYEAEVKVLVPEETELADCFPKLASIFVDQTVSVTVPVRVELGSYTVGEQIGIEAKSAVPQITVKGPKTILETIDCAKVITGPLGEITSSFENNLEYALFDRDGISIPTDYLVLPTRNVRVLFTVFKTKVVPLTVTSKNGYWTSEQMRYTVTPTSVIIKGEPALIDTVESVPAVIVDETQTDTNTLNLTLTPDQLALPVGVSLGETLGDVKISLNISDNRARNLRMKFTDTHVAVTAPAGGLAYRFTTDALSFRIRGTAQTINSATTDDFYLNIDLSEFDTAGEYDVPIEIVQTSASQGKYYAVGTYSVRVVIGS